LVGQEGSQPVRSRPATARSSSTALSSACCAPRGTPRARGKARRKNTLCGASPHPRSTWMEMSKRPPSCWRCPQKAEAVRSRSEAQEEPAARTDTLLELKLKSAGAGSLGARRRAFSQPRVGASARHVTWCAPRLVAVSRHAAPRTRLTCTTVQARVEVPWVYPCTSMTHTPTRPVRPQRGHQTARPSLVVQMRNPRRARCLRVRERPRSEVTWTHL
jgi:hypothetical protein